MTVFVQSVISGILVGGVYALIGIGLTMIFGVMRVINFAHGDLLMLGMYATWLVFTKLGIDPFVSIVITAPLLFLWGAFLQLVFINRVLNALPQNQILLTIGLGLVMSNSVMLAFTSDYRILTTTYSSSSFDVGGISISQPLLVGRGYQGHLLIMWWPPACIASRPDGAKASDVWPHRRAPIRSVSLLRWSRCRRWLTCRWP